MRDKIICEKFVWNLLEKINLIVKSKNKNKQQIKYIAEAEKDKNKRAK